jgi:antitoxin (DNA-binding transcriptional repressor) of toxin-antitoxin stability system
MWHITAMPSVNIRQLRDTRRLKAWLQQGKTVELRERDRLIGRIVPANGDQPLVEMPDFAARAKEIFGDRLLNSVDMLIEQRRRARY